MLKIPQILLYAYKLPHHQLPKKEILTLINEIVEVNQSSLSHYYIVNILLYL